MLSFYESQGLVMRCRNSWNRAREFWHVKDSIRMKLCIIGSRGHQVYVLDGLREMEFVKIVGISTGSEEDVSWRTCPNICCSCVLAETIVAIKTKLIAIKLVTIGDRRLFTSAIQTPLLMLEHFNFLRAMESISGTFCSLLLAWLSVIFVDVERWRIKN